jgi:hypothetical protein
VDAAEVAFAATFLASEKAWAVWWWRAAGPGGRCITERRKKGRPQVGR